VDRLDTLLSIHHNNFSPDAFEAFRDADLHEAGLVFARAGHARAVELLFRRHPHTFAGHARLDVLSAFPACLPPAAYRHLLPGYSPPPVSNLARKADWAEAAAACVAISTLAHAGAAQGPEGTMSAQALAACTEHVVRHMTPPTRSSRSSSCLCVREHSHQLSSHLSLSTSSTW
jgi:hypothetical protein